jgi:hypothetical protein
MPRTLARVAAIAALAVAVSATSASSASAQTPSARIHLIHGVPGVAVDVIAGGETVISNFEFGGTQDLSSLAGQTLAGVEVRVAGTDDVAIDAGDVDLPASGNYTVIAHLRADGQPTLGVFENATSTTSAGQGRLTVRHTAAAPAVDVLANGQAAFTNIASGEEASADLPAGTISASVVPTGATEPVVIGPSDLAIEDGTSLIVYAVGSLEDESLTVLTESITGVGTAPAVVNTGDTPVGGGTSGVAPLAVAMGGALLLGGTILAGRRLAFAKAH